MISVANTPEFVFQLKKAAWLIPATVVPSSACLMMNASYASVNFDAFMRFHSFPTSGESNGQRYPNENAFGDRSIGLEERR